MSTFRIIEEKEECKSNIVMARNMKPGQIGRIIEDGPYKNDIVMRNLSPNHFELLVISDPYGGNCWINSPDFKVELLKPGTRLTIEVGEDNIK